MAFQRKGKAQPEFGRAIKGTEELAGTLRDTFDAFKSGLGIPQTHTAQSSTTCEGCGASLSGRRKEVVRCEYCNRETRLR